VEKVIRLNTKCIGQVITCLCAIVSCNFLLGYSAMATARREAKKQPANDDSGMAWIPAGEFRMGYSAPGFNDTKPIHKVCLSGFWLDKTAVTNEQFAKFIEGTNYITVAERIPKRADFPDAPTENLIAGSLVFKSPERNVPFNNHYQWWQYVSGANWRHPEGPGSDIKNRINHPVVHIAWQDAQAYAQWADKRLPTEAEFEYAARGGLKQKFYSWGDQLKPGNKWQANIWQGNFPFNNTEEDGFLSTAPVCSFPANGFGLYDMAGNVWQWCSDWYSADYYKTLENKLSKNPRGPDNSFDPKEPAVAKRVQRGGSFLCSDQYCARYMAGARGKGEPDSSTCHVGFRCAKDK
jgi:sulfatase modifying factor 1